MRLLSTIEEKLSSLVEWPFAGQRTPDATALEIAVKRKLETDKRDIIGRIVVPSRICIVFDRCTYREHLPFFPLYSQSLMCGLQHWAEEHGYQMLGPLLISFSVASQEGRSFVVKTSYCNLIVPVGAVSGNASAGFLAAVQQGVTYALHGLPAIIGRGDQSEIQLNDLAVSSRHARLFLDRGKIMIEDLGSTNGLRVNRQRVLSGRLNDGDRIRIGHTELVFTRRQKR